MALTGAVLALLAVAGFWLVSADMRRDAAAELGAFAMHKAAAPAAAQQTSAPADIDLPVFSSARLTADFHAVAADTKLPVDEVSYALDSNVNQPYKRYRVTLAVKTRYPEIRKFVAALTNALPNVVLDAVRCGREDIAVSTLSCELSFSAFYRKSAHG